MNGGRYYQGSYPQYKGLTSGVSFIDGNDPIGDGLNDLQNSLISIAKQKQIDDTAREEKFNSLVQADISSVNDRFRDEAVRLRDDFINKARDLWLKDNKKLSWESTKEIEKLKQGLESFVVKHQQFNKWAQDAYKAAVKLDDQDRKATFGNINSIVNSDGSLDEVFNKTQSMDWLSISDKPVDWFKDIYPKLPKSYDKNGNFDVGKTEQGVIQLYNSGDKATTKLFEQQKASNPNLTIEEFSKNEAKRASLYANDNRYKPSTSKTDSSKTKTYEIERVGDEYNIGHLNKGKGVSIGTISDPKTGDNYTGAEIFKIKQVKDAEGKPKWVAMIRHNVDKKKYTEEEMNSLRKNFASDQDFSNYMIANKVGNNSKDMTRKGVIEVDYEQIKQALKDNGVILKGIDGVKDEEKSKNDVDPRVKKWGEGRPVNN